MGKLGKRARKFAKKHLQSVLKRRRSMKSMFKRKRLTWNKQEDGLKAKVEDSVQHPNESHGSVFYTASSESDDKIPSLTSIFGEDDSGAGEITSGDDPCEDLGDLHFAPPMEGRTVTHEFQFNNYPAADREKSTKGETQCCSLARSGRAPTDADVVTWKKRSAMEDTDIAALTNLLIIYQHACRCHRSGSTNDRRQIYASVTTFLLRNADTVFSRSLEPGSEIWKPLIRVYLRSTAALISRLSDPDTLEFSLIRVRHSLRFFSPFPALREKLIRASMEAWSAAGTRRSLCLRAFDVASAFPRILCSRYVAVARHRDPHHVALMRDCIVSTDASATALAAAVVRLQAILNHVKGKQTVCSPEYLACVDLCVSFVEARPRVPPTASALSLVRTVLQTVRLFPGPRYAPLRVVCVRWLNRIAAAAAVFIPVASLVLDMLEFRTYGPLCAAASPGPVLRLPKKGLMSLDAVVRHVVALLSAHFSVWFRHVSFPDLAVVPLVRLKRFCSTAPAGETSRRLVERFVDRVEMNVELVRRKREEISFSLADPQLAAAFVGDCAACVSLLRFYTGLAEKEP